MKIYLIRHGQSLHDSEKRYGGWYDDELTAKGRVQARKLATKLKKSGIKIIFTSPLLRAGQTAEILQKHLKCQLDIMGNIRERNFYGVLTGMKLSDAKKLYSKEVAKLSNYKNTIRDGESYSDFKKRILAAFDYLSRLDYDCIAVVTHGGPISCLFRESIGKEIKSMDDCCLAVLEKKGRSIEIVSLNGIKTSKKRS